MAGVPEYRARQDLNRAFAEGRYRVVTGPSAGSNPHAPGSDRAAAWTAGAGYVIPNSSAYQAPATPHWSAVAANGSTRLTNATNLGYTTPLSSVTFCLGLDITSYGNRQLIGAQFNDGISTNAQIGTNNSGALTVAWAGQASDIGFEGQFRCPVPVGCTGTGLVPVGQMVIWHVALSFVDRTAVGYLNGIPCRLADTSGVVGGTTWLDTAGTLPAPTQWVVGGRIPSGGNWLGRLCLVWLAPNQYLTDPALFSPSYPLGATMSAPGVQPLIGFGDDQTAAQWNAGTNKGSGTGSWTLLGGYT